MSLAVTGEPLVSVITPTYNHGPWVDQCIASVRAQRYRTWEQIVIDDGSTDSTVNAAVAARDNDPRVRVERQDHHGIERLATTYNRALAASRGSLIATLEGDDRWTPGMLSALVPLFEQPDVVIAYGVTAIISADGRTGQHIPSARFKHRFGVEALTNNPRGSATRAMLNRGGLVYTYPCSTLIRRAALETIGGFKGFDEFGSVDLPTYAHLGLVGSFGFRDEVLAEWRVHGAAASWQRHDLMLQQAQRFVRSFARAHESELGHNAVRKIEHSWHHHEQLLALDAGRRALVERRWLDARPHFGRAMRGSGLVAVAAVLGYGGSWLRRDIESFIRLTGRGIDYRALREPPSTARATTD
jgi:glycosyltransferase involved in cell wall biosynthesis